MRICARFDPRVIIPGKGGRGMVLEHTYPTYKIANVSNNLKPIPLMKI
jgi:hypothetical protein